MSTTRRDDDGPAPIPSTRGRSDPRGRRRRTELLNAAIAIIGTNGIDAVTHRAVAIQAGVPAASTSYYFRSKDELIDEALDLVATREIERLRELHALVDDPVGDPAVWASAIAGWVEEQLDGTARTELVALYHLQLESARRADLREHQERWSEPLREMATDAMRRLGAADPDSAAVVLVCAVDGLRLNALSAKGTELRGDHLRGLLEHLLRGLASG